MSFSQVLGDISSRISDIESRFAPTTPPPASAAEATPFSQVLAAARLESAQTGGVDFDAAVPGDATGPNVVNTSKRYLGVPYVWGGTDPNTGLDCSGLVQRAYADLGVKVPRVAADQARQGTPVASLAQAKPGDLVAFGTPVDHIGIYAGDNKMVVAPKRGDVVKVQEITRPATAIRRIVPDTATAGRVSLGSASNPLAGYFGTIPSASATAAVSGTTASAPGASAYDSLFQAAGAKHGVSPELLSAVARAESGYNPAAKSSAGALGLMQIMPQTAKGIGVDPMDPAQAVDGAARILAGNLQKFNGSVPLAVAAYNAGAGAVSRYNGIPPFTETQNYVRRVLSYAGVAQ